VVRSKKSKDEKVQKFLDDIEVLDTEKHETLLKLRKMVFSHFSNAIEQIKYGGIVFLADDHLFSGLFVRKNHISLEFVHGSEMNDPKKILEGTGKLRRHLKIRCLTDIKDKNADFFIKQSL
jgi:hypothetical protein